MTTRPLACCVLLLAAATLGTTAAKADDFDHIDNLAVRLQRQAAALYGEFREHYSHTRRADYLMSDAAMLYRLASHVHEVAHTGGNVFHLRNDIAELDRTFHHVESLVDAIERETVFNPFGGGHVHGSTADVRALMRTMEDTLHHLRSDVNRAAYVPPVYGTGYGTGFGTGGYVYGPGGVLWRTGSLRP